MVLSNGIKLILVSVLLNCGKKATKLTTKLTRILLAGKRTMKKLNL